MLSCYLYVYPLHWCKHALYYTNFIPFPYKHAKISFIEFFFTFLCLSISKQHLSKDTNKTQQIDVHL